MLELKVCFTLALEVNMTSFIIIAELCMVSLGAQGLWIVLLQVHKLEVTNGVMPLSPYVDLAYVIHLL